MDSVGSREHYVGSMMTAEAEVKKIEINWPDEPGKCVHTEVEDMIAFVKYAHDCDTLNPLEDGYAIGTIHSFCTRHINHIDPEDVDMTDKDIVVLSYFEHGPCIWGVRGTMGGMPDFMWDGVGVAGIWQPDDELLKQAKKHQVGSPVRRAMMERWAAQACEVYTAWCNGDVFYYNVCVHWARHADDSSLFDDEDDYRFEDPLRDDCCGGFYGSDEEYMKECMLDIIKGVMEEHHPEIPRDSVCWS